MAQANRTFRVFVSSTFDDLKAERNAPQERVFRLGSPGRPTACRLSHTTALAREPLARRRLFR
jgi:hypothetical protein